jgi:hypothetical protein
MSTRLRVAATGILAAILLSLVIGSSSANRLSISSRFFRVVWNPLVFGTAGIIMRCPVTLEGSFHSATVRKVSNALVGYITRAGMASCTEGSATMLAATLPWHVRYESFQGVLPNITGIALLLIGASYRVDPGGIPPACLSRTTEANPLRGIANLNGSHVLTGFTVDSGPGIPLSEGFGCGIAEGHFSGTGTVTPLGATGSLTVTLI